MSLHQPAADERLFATHYLPVMRLCLSRLHDPSDAEDATQEVFRRALQHAGQLRDENPLPWLIAVAKNVCRDELRRRRSGAAALSHATDPAAAAVSAERVVVGHMYVDELLGRLTPAERRAMAARLSSGDTRSLGESSTPRVLLARARHKLRRYIEDARAAFVAMPLLATRATHALRRRMLERAWTGQGRSALLLPAALIFTVVMGPGKGAPAAVGPGGAARPASPNLSVPGSLGVAGLDRAQPLGTHGGAPPSAFIPDASPSMRPTPGATPSSANGSPLEVLQRDPQEVDTSDIEPSPNYATDHTLLMVGTSAYCTPTTCSQIYKSTDGGSTWSYMTGFGVQSGSLLLPPATYAAGHFYVTSNMGGILATHDNGATFTPLVPAMAWSIATAPAWSGLDVVMSNDALWQLRDGMPPMPMSTLPTDTEAGGPALVIPRAGGGFDALQPVALVGDTTNANGMVVHCTPTCAQSVPVPTVNGRLWLVPSPYRQRDHTIWAVGRELTVSHDDGWHFELVSPSYTYALEMQAIPGPRGVRLVAVVVRGPSFPFLVYSDDGGVTWKDSAIRVHITQYARSLQVVHPGRLIVSMMRADPRPMFHHFLCSTDGTEWAPCSPEGTS